MKYGPKGERIYAQRTFIKMGCKDVTKSHELWLFDYEVKLPHVIPQSIQGQEKFLKVYTSAVDDLSALRNRPLTKSDDIEGMLESLVTAINGLYDLMYDKYEAQAVVFTALASKHVYIDPKIGYNFNHDLRTRPQIPFSATARRVEQEC